MKIKFRYLLLVFFLGFFRLNVFASSSEWMYDQITEDLKAFKNGFHKEDIDRTLKDDSYKEYNLVKFVIQKKLASYFPQSYGENKEIPKFIEKRIQHIVRAIETILKNDDLPDIEFIASMQDSLDGIDFNVPVFAFAKNAKNSPKIVLMPDFEALSGNFKFHKKLDEGREKYPWAKKINIAFWRGGTTGGDFTLDSFLEFPRSKAVTLSHLYPELIDARFTNLVQCKNCNEIKSLYEDYFSENISIKKHLKYKYQILIDGNSSAYSRAYWQLFSGCVMFKQESDSIQWYYRCLKPYVHYIPLNTDLSDLPEAILWAKDHDSECKIISDQAVKFAKKNLTQKKVLKYFKRLLLEYAKIY